MRRRRCCWAVALIFPLFGCGDSSTGAPDTGDVPGDAEEGGADADADGDADADADADADNDGADGDADADADADNDGADGDADADVDADDEGGDGDADADAAAKRTGISLTSGGGRASSPGYQLTLSIGTPQPMGAASGGTHGAALGPGTVVNQ